MSISLFATWKGYSHPAVVMALSKQQVSNLRKELRENRTVNNAVTLSAEKRSAKIAKLQQYLDTVPKGARKTSLQKELEKFKSFTGLIAASEQEEQSTPATTDARPAKKQKVALQGNLKRLHVHTQWFSKACKSIVGPKKELQRQIGLQQTCKTLKISVSGTLYVFGVSTGTLGVVKWYSTNPYLNGLP